MTLVDVREELLAKTKSLDGIFDAAKTAEGYDFTKVSTDLMPAGDQKARVEHVQGLMAEVNDLGAKADEFAKLAADAERVKGLGEDLAKAGHHHPGGSGIVDAGELSFGEMFVQSASYQKDRAKSREFDIDLAKLGGGNVLGGIKTLMTTSAGFAPQAIRTGRIVEAALRPISVIDMIPGEVTDQTAVVYMEETTATNNAAEAAEGAGFGEAALAFTQRTSSVRKIAVWLPVTDEQLEDAPQIQSYINNRLGFFVRQRLDSQILVGDGTPPNLEGLNIRSGVQTQAATGLAALDALRIAKRKVAVTGRANANTLFINPLNMEYLALLRTPDGVYILANPNDDTGLERLWGMRVVETDAQTANTALVKDTTMTGLAIKRNVTVKVTDSHASQFIEGEQAIRCDMRVALQDYRPASGCTVTAMPQA